VRILSEHHRSSPWSVKISKWSIILNRLKSLEKLFWKKLIFRQTNCLWWSDYHQGPVRSPAPIPGWSGHQRWPVRPPASILGQSDRHQGRSDCQTSNGREKFQSWVVLQSDHEMRRTFPMASFWSVDYKSSSISYKTSLLSISTAYLTLKSPLPSHTSIPWFIVGVWDSSA
jgi:hypothetical protein